jgi:hypothetical protein
MAYRFYRPEGLVLVTRPGGQSPVSEVVLFFRQLSL